MDEYWKTSRFCKISKTSVKNISDTESMSLKFVKGQIISEGNFQKNNEIIARISALVSKIGQIKKIKVHYHAN